MSVRKFIDLITEAWSDHAEPAPDGGITLHMSPLYDEFHDAVRTAEHCGLRRTGSTITRTGDSKWWGVYRDADGAGVAIKPDGSAYMLARNRMRRTKPTNSPQTEPTPIQGEEP